MQMQVTTPVPLSDLQPGDLLFYYDSPGYVGHVTMYVGSRRDDPGRRDRHERDDHADLVHEPRGSRQALTRPSSQSELTGPGQLGFSLRLSSETPGSAIHSGVACRRHPAHAVPVDARSGRASVPVPPARR